MYICPKGHNSDEADFCSECGAKITGLGIAELSSNPTSGTSASSSISCPDCSTPHEADSGNFCEICGYNFASGAKGGVAFPTPQPVVQSTITPQPTPISAPTVAVQWQATICIDRSLATPESPPAPDLSPMTIPLTKPISAIGRTSQGRAIYPDLPLDFDDAVSSRHAILTQQADGSIILRDIGSSNGTMVNGKEIAIMADIIIRSGDEITLGHWTKIKLTNS
jgi:DNA-directed RNA polymerase subunit RPC12/RpoP